MPNRDFDRHSKHKSLKTSIATSFFIVPTGLPNGLLSRLGTCLCFGAAPDERLLRPVQGEVGLAGFGGLQPLPAADAMQNALNLIGIRALQVLTLLAEALTPDFHNAYLLAAHSSLALCIAKLTLAEEAAPLIQIHPIPIFKQKRIELVRNDTLAVVVLHGFLLLHICLCCRSAGQKQFFTGSVLDNGLRPQLVDHSLRQCKHGLC